MCTNIIKLQEKNQLQLDEQSRQCTRIQIIKCPYCPENKIKTYVKRFPFRLLGLVRERAIACELWAGTNCFESWLSTCIEKKKKRIARKIG